MKNWSAAILSAVILLVLAAPTGGPHAAAIDHNRDAKRLDLQDVQVSTELTDDYEPRIARHQDHVYTVWHDDDDAISLGISSDGGSTWERSVAITGTRPAVVVDVYGNLHVAYEHSHGVYYTMSGDSGQTFSSPLSLGTGCAPDIAVNAKGNPYIVWQEKSVLCDDKDEVNQVTDIVLSRIEEHDSVDLGTTITKTIVSTTTLGYSAPPQVAVSPSGQNVYVIWQCTDCHDENGNGVYETGECYGAGHYMYAHFTRSTDGGNTFDLRLSPTDFERDGEFSPDVAAFGENVVFVALLHRYQSADHAVFTYSEDSGRTFSPPSELGESGINCDATIGVDVHGNVCVVWQRGADLYSRCSPNGGQSFLPARQIVSGSCDTQHCKPAVALWSRANVTYLDVVWEDTRNGNLDVFFSSVWVLMHYHFPAVMRTSS